MALFGLLAALGQAAPTEPTPPPCDGSNYTVKEGDDCTKIAVSAFTTAAALIAANNIPDECRNLQVGQVICIPRAPVCHGENYIVQAGDDCSKIGTAKGVTADSIIMANNITDGCTTLQVGQALYVPSSPSD
jgi:LysM repeat protein